MLTPAQRKVLEKIRDGWELEKFSFSCQLRPPGEWSPVKSCESVNLNTFNSLFRNHLIYFLKHDNRRDYYQITLAGREALGGENE